MNMICTVVDKATKMCHFIPCSDTSTAKGTALLHWQHVGRLHGIPSIIIFDRRLPIYEQILARAMASPWHRSSDGVRVPS